MKNIINFFLKFNRTTLSLLSLIFLWGSLTYMKIPTESFPDIKIPIVLVNVPYEGISPEDAETILVKPIEKEVRSLEGLKKMSSSAFEGGAHLTLEFEAGADTKVAKADVKDAIDAAKAELPRDLQDPQIQEISTSNFPILTIKLSGNVAEQTLVTLARNLKDEIEARVSEVLEARIQGDREEMVQITVDPKLIQSYELPLNEVISLFSQNNKLITGGPIDYDTGQFPIKVPGLVNTVESLMNLPLVNNKERTIKFKDVARVSKKYKDPRSYARDRGQRAVTLEITKRAGENIIDTVKAIKHLLVEAQKLQEWPMGVKVSYSQDQTERIQNMLNDLQNALILALILVMVIIVYTMGWRPSVLVGLAVPGSFLMGILALNFLGLTLNMIVLFSLILAVGMLVDGAIIVVEYADRRMKEGYSSFEAYQQAALRMALPVLTSIGTILLVFMPLLYWPGVVGEFMKFMPITLIATLGGSIAMALFFVPTLGSIWDKRNKRASKTKTVIQEETLDDIKGVTAKYVLLLKKALERPKTIIWSSIGALVLIVSLYRILSPGVAFFPDTEPEQARIAVRARGNLSLKERDDFVKQVENKLVQMPELESVYSTSFMSAGGKGGFGGGSSPRDSVGFIYIEFVDWEKRRPATTIIDEIRQKTKGIPAIKLDITTNKMGPPTGKPIQLRIVGNSWDKLEKATSRMVGFMVKEKSFENITDTRFLPGLQWNVSINRAKASKYFTSIEMVGNMLRLLTRGLKVGTTRPEGLRDEIDVYLRFAKEKRNLDELMNFRVQTPVGVVPISHFASISPAPKVDRIRRLDGSRVITVESDVRSGFLASEQLSKIKTFAKELQAQTEDIKILYEGDDKEQREAGSFLGGAFGLAIFMVLIVLVTQFNSYFSALLVLSSVVMSTIGVFIGLMIHQIPFSIVMCGVGVISLAGIIVSNNIILIDTFDQLKTKMANMKEAILLTCAQRLRPIILTQVTVILGLLPIMYGVNIDFMNLHVSIGAPFTQFWKPLSVCIVYGVFFASALTLFVTPAALWIRENRKKT